MVLPLGFIFSMEEPSALIQEQGGPCAIIASVQVTKLMLYASWESVLEIAALGLQPWAALPFHVLNTPHAVCIKSVPRKMIELQE